MLQPLWERMGRSVCTPGARQWEVPSRCAAEAGGGCCQPSGCTHTPLHHGLGAGTRGFIFPADSFHTVSIFEIVSIASIYTKVSS